MDAGTTDLIETTLRHMSFSYYGWFAVYVGLGVTAVMLPGLAAVGIGSPETQRRLAAAAALVAATFAVLKPHEYATGFDVGKRLVWQTEIAWRLGTIDEAEVARRLEEAVAVTTFRYGGKASASSSALEDLFDQSAGL